MTVAVTGASGFVGGAVCRDLAARGLTVVPMSRATGYALSDPAPTIAAGVATIVHCAHDPTDPRLNVDGTWRLLDAAFRAGVRQFVFVSSLAAHAGARSAYGRAKWDLERRLAGVNGLTVTVIKPGTVLGNGGLFARVRQMAKLPALPVFYGTGRLQTVLIDDLCAAIAVTVERRLPGTFVVAEADGVPVAEFYRAVAALDGRRPWLVRLPGPLALPALMLTERAGLRLPVTTDNLLGLKHLVHFDTGPTRAALGLSPRDFHAALAELR